MYFVFSGVLEVVVGRRPLAKIKQGEFFGEVALLTHNKRNASIKALTHASLLTLHKSDFLVLCEQYPEVEEQLRQASSMQLWPQTVMASIVIIV